MVNNEVKLKESILIGTTFLILTLILFTLFFYNHVYLLLPLCLISGIFSISILTRPFKKNRIVKVFDFFASWILGIFYLIGTIWLSFALIYLSVIIVWAILKIALDFIIILLQHYEVLNNYNVKYDTAVIYISSLIAAIIMSYFGQYIIVLIDKIFGYSATNKTDTPRKISLLIFKHINLRKRVYELSIIMYVLSVIETLTNTLILNNIFWITYKPVALEVMLTFVAFDTYIMNFYRKGNKEKNEKLLDKINHKNNRTL
jgi:hypothetical protein